MLVCVAEMKGMNEIQASCMGIFGSVVVEKGGDMLQHP